MKKCVSFLFILCLGTMLLMGCSNSQGDDETKAAGETEATDALQSYQIEGVGTFYLPEGFQSESGFLEEPLPMSYAQLTKGDMIVAASRFGADAYEAAGVSMPADLEEYSQRDGVRQGLPEEAEFAEDDYGNLYVQYVQDGTTVYLVLKKGAESYGSITIYCPEGEESADFALWASKFELED